MWRANPDGVPRRAFDPGRLMAILFSIVFGYLFGSVPFGLVITRLAGMGDIRSIGSGNIGATNVLRTGRKDLALATFLLDSGKGAIAVGLAHLAGWPPEPAAAAAFLGHCFPVWLKFKGGKGVATFIGSILALNWAAGLFTALTWLGVAYVFRFSSLAALVAAAGSPLFFFAMGDVKGALAVAFMTILIFIRHHQNIERLLRGEEPRIGQKETAKEAINHSASDNE